MVRGKERGEAIARRCLIIVLMLPVLYLLSAAVVFDFTSTAWDFDCEGRAHGPHPRMLLCRPMYFDWPGGASWDGTEWAFSAYRPLCIAWLRLKGIERGHQAGN